MRNWKVKSSSLKLVPHFSLLIKTGGLAQLARALAWHARGQRFESVILHIGRETAKRN